MNMMDRIDPELKAPLDGFLAATNGGFNLHDIPGTRKGMEQLMEAMMSQIPAIEGVKTEDRLVAGPTGAPQVPVRIYQPTQRADTLLPAMLWIHGGGYVLGNVEQDDVSAKIMALTINCVVVSVEYRLAPENPFPAPLEDCYAALKWLAAHTKELGIDKSRIAIGGASAGGGLTAGLALLTRDRAEVELAYQLLIYPMIDNENVAPASGSLSDHFLWSRDNNIHGWESYLGGSAGKDVSPYAAPSRASDLKGLPSAYIAVGDLDLFLKEDLDYAARLNQAEVATEVHVYPGGYHGFNGFAPEADITKRFNADRDNALKRALHG